MQLDEELLLLWSTLIADDVLWLVGLGLPVSGSLGLVVLQTVRLIFSCLAMLLELLGLSL